MGKPKLRSSMKTLHQALINFRAPGPKTMTWVCIQPAKTHSFRDVCNSFNSSSSTSSQLSISSLNEETEDSQEEARGGPEMLSLRLPEAESFSCSSLTSSSLSTEFDDSSSGDLVSKILISSKRFFFSPCTTKSIMEQVSPLAEVVVKEEEINRDVWNWKWESATMEMTTENPYEDFRESMKEMVEAHGMKDWSGLQELLHCYLRLNDSSAHDTIVAAFVDLLINLIAAEESSLTD